MGQTTEQVTVLTGEDAAAIRSGALAYRDLGDGRELVLYRMIPGQVRLAVGPVGEGWMDDFYCYNDPIFAFVALASWDGHDDAPDGWHRHGGTGRRREVGPAGETLREWVNP